MAGHFWRYALAMGFAWRTSRVAQSFVRCTTGDGWTFAANTESSFNWMAEARSVSVNLTTRKLLR